MPPGGQRTLARAPNWASILTVSPGAEVPVEATLVSARAVETFMRVLRAAEGFGTRGLRVRCERKRDAAALKALQRAASGFSHVEWV
ncbi:hypothetical protein [Pyxidicoccus caerfyrddinensis]|uniref:hypothetical protein n=1 Tax=Pyxidicoccus caerfyrddinensis TaxID=2709663 RepID=UPI0013DC464A|nr:hypothetical protein [Pyxidicoccus caerfyrddinensis]